MPITSATHTRLMRVDDVHENVNTAKTELHIEYWYKTCIRILTLRKHSAINTLGVGLLLAQLTCVIMVISHAFTQCIVAFMQCEK